VILNPPRPAPAVPDSLAPARHDLTPNETRSRDWLTGIKVATERPPGAGQETEPRAASRRSSTLARAGSVCAACGVASNGMPASL